MAAPSLLVMTQGCSRMKKLGLCKREAIGKINGKPGAWGAAKQDSVLCSVPRVWIRAHWEKSVNTSQVNQWLAGWVDEWMDDTCVKVLWPLYRPAP